MDAPAVVVDPYLESTQRRYWLFSEQELQRVRDATYARAQHCRNLALAEFGPLGEPAGDEPSASKRPRLAMGTPQAALPDTPTGAPPSTGMRPPQPPNSASGTPVASGDFTPAATPRESGSATAAAATAAAAAAAARDASAAAPLSQAEERLLCRHWELRTLAAGAAAGLPRSVTATAIVYQKRFWLSASPIEMSPADVLAAALFLAVKVEGDPYLEVPELHRRLGDTLGKSSAQMAAREADLMLALRFHLTAYHCFDAARGLVRRAAAGAASAGPGCDGHAAALSDDAKAALLERVLHFADVAQTCDAPLLSTPAQLAAACLILAAQHHPDVGIPLNSEPPETAAAAVSAAIDAVIAAAATAGAGRSTKALGQAEGASSSSSSAAAGSSAASAAREHLSRLGQLVLEAAAALDLAVTARALDRRRRATVNPAFAEEGAGAAAKRAAKRALETDRQQAKDA